MSLLQMIPIKDTIFCKRDLEFYRLVSVICLICLVCVVCVCVVCVVCSLACADREADF